MKKMISILLVMAIVMVGAFAADPLVNDTVVLKSTIASEFVWGVSSNSYKSLIAVDGTVVSIPETHWGTTGAEFSNVFANGATAYLGFITNKAYASAAPTISISATPFVLQEDNASIANPAANQKVGYTMTGHDATTPLVVYGAEVGSNVSTLSFDGTGLRGDESTLTFVATKADVDKAQAGDYVANITFTIASI